MQINITEHNVKQNNKLIIIVTKALIINKKQNCFIQLKYMIKIN